MKQKAIKYKSSPKELKSGDYLQQGCLQGLSEEGKKFALTEIKNWQRTGLTPPYGLIRKMALEK